MEAIMTRRLGLVAACAATAGLLIATPSNAEQPKAKAPGAGRLAVAQLPCGSRKEMLDILTKSYGEREVAHGLANTGALAQLFVGPDGSWTIVATSPSGTSCLIGAGHSWERKPTQATTTGSYDEGI
jgi:hypothetical protein